MQGNGSNVAGVTEGPARVFAPVLKHPRDYPQGCVGGPMGFVEVDRIETPEPGPIFVRPPSDFAEREPVLAGLLAECSRAAGRVVEARRETP